MAILAMLVRDVKTHQAQQNYINGNFVSLFSSCFQIHGRSLLFGGLLGPPLVICHELGEVVGDGQVELVDRASPEAKVVLVYDRFLIRLIIYLKKVQVDWRLGKS